MARGRAGASGGSGHEFCVLRLRILGAWAPVWRLLSTKLNQWRVGSWIVTLLPVAEFWVGRTNSRGGLPLIHRDFAGLALCLDSVEGTPERSRRGFPSSKHS